MPVVTWLRTATGGQVSGFKVVAFEVEQRNIDRWVIEAHTDDGSAWELSGEYQTRQAAAVRCTRLARRVNERDTE